jgi:TonB family protein
MNRVNAIIIIVFVGLLGFLGGLFFAKWQEGQKPKRLVLTRVSTPVFASVVKRVEPIYPASALKDGTEGSVGLLVEVGDDGSPSSISIMRTVRSDVDSAAMSAVRLWKFSPGGAKAVVSLDFSLKGKGRPAR